MLSYYYSYLIDNLLSSPPKSPCKSKTDFVIFSLNDSSARQAGRDGDTEQRITDAEASLYSSP